MTQQTRGARVLTFDYSAPLRTVVTRARKDHVGNALPSAVFFGADDDFPKGFPTNPFWPPGGRQ